VSEKVAEPNRGDRGIQASGSQIWRILAWIGSFGLGLTAFLFLADMLDFDYHSLAEIVATPAFEFYPEWQDWWLYLLALSVIPLFTLAGYGVWTALVSLHRRIHIHAGSQDVALLTLSFLLWWIDPLALAYGQRTSPWSVYLPGGLFVVGNSLLLAHRWLQRRALSHPSDIPPPLSLQGAMVLLGGGLGLSLLTSPFRTSLQHFPVQTVLALAGGIWGLWLGTAYLLSRLLRRSWSSTAGALAVGCLPLSLLFLVDVLWWETWQGGVRVDRHGSDVAVMILLLVSLLACVVVAFWALRSWDAEAKVWRKVFWRGFFGLAVPLLLYALAYDPNVHGPLDLFHEGERLAPAQALMAGKVPYRDVVFVHGFLRDPGVALVAFRLFGVSVEALRTLEQLLAPLALVASYYLALACLGGGWALLYALLVLTGFWPVFYDWKMVPALAALACWILYLKQRRLGWAVGAGFLTFVALATSFDTGMVALASGAVLCGALTLAGWREVKLALVLGYVLPLLLPLVGALLYFASVGALPSLVGWHLQILDVYRDWNGMPFPLPPESFGQAWASILSPLASVATIVLLGLVLIRRQWKSWHWIALLLLVANVALFNRGIVGGTTTGTALITGSHFAPLLLLLLLVSFTSSRRLLRIGLVALLSFTLLIPTPTDPASGRSLLEVMARLPDRNRVVIPASWVRSGVERVGALFLPVEQERSLAEIVTFLKGATFWDFSDHGALYFLSDGQSPTRFYTTHHVITGQNQREVIADLARSPPPYLIYRSNSAWDAIAGVDRTIRSFLVSEYLLRNYRLAGQVGGFTVLEQGVPTASADALSFRVDMGYVPFVWGRDRISALERLRPVTVTGWDFAAEGLDGWQPVHGVSLSEVREDGWHVRTVDARAQLQHLALDLDPRSVTYATLRMRAGGADSAAMAGQLFWRFGEEPFAEGQSVRFRIRTDGGEHLYLLRLASLPGWAWSGPITGLRLDLVNASTDEIAIRSLDLIQVDELAASGQ
jgi:hypothetical protein